MYRERHRSRSWLCKTKAFFIVIAVLMSITVGILSYRWTVSERVYKVSQLETHSLLKNIQKVGTKLGQIQILANSQSDSQGGYKNNFLTNETGKKKITEPIKIGISFPNEEPVKDIDKKSKDRVEIHHIKQTAMTSDTTKSLSHYSNSMPKHSVMKSNKVNNTGNHSEQSIPKNNILLDLAEKNQSQPEKTTRLPSNQEASKEEIISLDKEVKLELLNPTTTVSRDVDVHKSSININTSIPSQTQNNHIQQQAETVEGRSDKINTGVTGSPTHDEATRRSTNFTKPHDLSNKLNNHISHQTVESTSDRSANSRNQGPSNTIARRGNHDPAESREPINNIANEENSDKPNEQGSTKHLKKVNSEIQQTAEMRKKYFEETKKEKMQRLLRLKEEIMSERHRLNNSNNVQGMNHNNKGLSSYSKIRSRLDGNNLRIGNDTIRNSEVGNLNLRQFPTVRPNTCQGCFTLDFKNMINEEELCKNKKVKLIILITSAPNNHLSRNAIRETWGGACVTPNSIIKCAFVFGNRNNSAENQILINESKTFHDILQFDFKDSYANLTYKTMVLLKWSRQFCPEAEFVMKTDDDMWVNTELLPVLLQEAPNSGLLGGSCWGSSPPHRHESSKWHVPFHMFTRPLYPPMCSGTGYIVTPDVIEGLLKVSPNIPYFYLEDVFVALCLKEMGIAPKYLEGFSNVLAEYNACLYRNKYITSHSFSHDTLRYVWELSRECPKMNNPPLFVYSATSLTE